MRFTSESLSLNETEFVLLRDLIHDRTGLFYENERRDILVDRLSPLVIERGFASFLDYYYLLKYDGGTRADWQQVVDRLSVQETFFWREIDQIHALVDIIVPQLVAARPGQSLRIWSAACATGEEPLTIAMALNEAGWFQRAPIEIFGSDASPMAIEKARQGAYRDRSFRNLSTTLREKYFVQRDGLWWIASEIHSRVEWTTANLMVEQEVAPLASAAVIFCRNVFIYFSEQAIHKTVRFFFEHMPSPGHLFVGVSESLFRLTADFELQEIGNAFVYVKR